jgi:GH18 family chitinase
MPAEPSRRFRIVGYVTDLDAIISQVRFDQLTHVNYAFLLPNADGSITGVANSWKLKDLVAKAHASDVKVLISVGGWGWDEQFEVLASQPETRSRFVRELDAFAEAYNLDGVDIDWEYPGPEAASAQNFVALMTELDTVLHGKGKLLTAAVVASGSTGDGVLPDVFDRVDFLNIMAYDGPGTHHSSYAYAGDALNYWRARGLRAGKTVLGVPFYARPIEMPYRKLVQANPDAANVDEIDYFGRKAYYNGIPTIQRKTELAMRQASGIMIWNLAHDTNDASSLLSAIYRTAYGDVR